MFLFNSRICIADKDSLHPAQRNGKFYDQGKGCRTKPWQSEIRICMISPVKRLTKHCEMPNKKAWTWRTWGFESCSAAFEAIPVVELVLLSCLGRKADLKPHLLLNITPNLAQRGGLAGVPKGLHGPSYSPYLQWYLSREPSQELCPHAKQASGLLWSENSVDSSAWFKSLTNKLCHPWSLFCHPTQKGRVHCISLPWE